MTAHSRSRSRARCALAALASVVALGGCIRELDLGSDTGALAVFVGSRNGCVRNGRGELRCAGANEWGELASDPALEGTLCAGVPCHIQGTHAPVANVVTAAVGHGFVCASTSDAVVSCWGSNRFGTLGRGGLDDNPHAEPFATDPVGDVRVVLAGRHHACALLVDGSAACWGLGNHGELGRDPATLPACGTVDTAADANSLELPMGTTIRCASSPLAVPAVAGATELRTGPFATCFGTASGFACAGRNVDGSLGLGATPLPPPVEVVSTPTPLAVGDAVDVALGLAHGCAVDSLGRVFCFGHHDLGQLGLGAVTAALDDCGGVPCAAMPARVIDLATATHVVAGDAHTCVRLADDTIRCFGSDAHGQMGDSAAVGDDCSGTPCARSPRQPVFLDTVSSMVAGGDDTFVITRSGTPMTFGSNAYGQRSAGSLHEDAFPSEFYGVPR